MTTQCFEWHNCFRASWKGMVTEKGVFDHPAKFSRSLLARMVRHLEEMRWIRRRGWVLDPFAGVGCGGLQCAYRGYRWVGIEVEKRFVDTANRNFGKFLDRWEVLGLPVPQVFLGDSRDLSGVLKKADCILSAPPSRDLVADQGHNEGSGAHGEEHRRGRHRKATSLWEYGHTPGQLSNMNLGTVDAVLSSPPYESVQLDQMGDPEKRAERLRQRGFSEAHIRHILSNSMKDNYAEGEATEAQIGQKGGETFWSAARQIVEQCHNLLKTNGMAVWNVKDFIRKGQRVEFADDWLRLCQNCGFELVCRHRAMLVSTKVKQSLFGPQVVTTDTKSFFKRVNEANGSPPIDWEDVLCMRKVGN